MQTSRVFALSFAALGLLAAGPAFANGSSATGFYAQFTFQDTNQSFLNVNSLSGGNTTSIYNKRHSSGPVHKVQIIDTLSGSETVLELSAKDLFSHVEGKLLGSVFKGTGDATATGFRMVLKPKGALGTATVPYLVIVADSLQETGTFERKDPKNTATDGVANVKNLTIFGTLVKNRTIKFSGIPDANKSLYRSRTVTVTLHEKYSTALSVSCFPACVQQPFDVRTSVLHITFNNAMFGNQKVTGYILIDAADAGIEGWF